MSDHSAIIDAHAGDDLSSLGGEWEVDPTHSTLEFVVRYAMFTLVRGRFTSFSGAVEIDPSNLEMTQIAVDIDASSVDSAMAVRDEHLRGEEFFDVERHPNITFRSRGATVLGAGRYAVSGDLTIRGVTQPVRLGVDLFGRAPDVMGNPRLGFRATARLQRARWDITWNAPVLGVASPWTTTSIWSSTCRWYLPARSPGSWRPGTIRPTTEADSAHDEVGRTRQSSTDARFVALEEVTSSLTPGATQSCPFVRVVPYASW